MQAEHDVGESRVQIRGDEEKNCSGRRGLRAKEVAGRERAKYHQHEEECVTTLCHVAGTVWVRLAAGAEFGDELRERCVELLDVRTIGHPSAKGVNVKTAGAARVSSSHSAFGSFAACC